MRGPSQETWKEQVGKIHSCMTLQQFPLSALIEQLDSRDIEEFDNSTNQPDLTDIHGTLHPKAAECCSVQALTDHI